MLLIFRSAAPILGHASVALSCYNRLQSRNSDVQKPLFCSYSEKSQLHTDSVTPSYAERKHSKKVSKPRIYSSVFLISAFRFNLGAVHAALQPLVIPCKTTRLP